MPTTNNEPDPTEIDPLGVEAPDEISVELEPFDYERHRNRWMFVLGMLVAALVIATSYAVVAFAEGHQPDRHYIDNAWVTITPGAMCSYDGDDGWYPGDDYGGVFAP